MQATYTFSQAMDTPPSAMRIPTLPYGRDTWVDTRPEDAHDPSDRSGEVIAEAYTLLRRIGGGSGGEVYEALHQPTGARIALKVLHGRHKDSKALRKRFEREARAAGRIRHPHIVKLFDAGIGRDGTPWQAMELLEGHDLADVLEQRELDVSETVQMGIQLLSAIEAVHRLGYVHRDIKPENVFLVRQNDLGVWIKLLDFGIVKPMSPTESMPWVTEQGVLLGTPQFMAPEQITGESPVSARTDVWAAGALLFTALTGHPPFEDSQLSRLLVKIAREPAPSIAFHRPDAPTALAEVIARALRNRPEDRFAGAVEMAEALGRCASHVRGLR